MKHSFVEQGSKWKGFSGMFRSSVLFLKISIWTVLWEQAVNVFCHKVAQQGCLFMLVSNGPQKSFNVTPSNYAIAGRGTLILHVFLHCIFSIFPFDPATKRPKGWLCVCVWVCVFECVCVCVSIQPIGVCVKAKSLEVKKPLFGAWEVCVCVCVCVL